MAGEAATLVADATPYMTAAVGAYGAAVLAQVRDDTADATVGLGRKLLQRVLSHHGEEEPLPAPLTELVAYPDDADVLASASTTMVTQYVRAGRDAYVAGRDMTVNRPAD